MYIYSLRDLYQEVQNPAIKKKNNRDEQLRIYRHSFANPNTQQSRLAHLRQMRKKKKKDDKKESQNTYSKVTLDQKGRWRACAGKGTSNRADVRWRCAGEERAAVVMSAIFFVNCFNIIPTYFFVPQFDPSKLSTNYGK